MKFWIWSHWPPKLYVFIAHRTGNRLRLVISKLRPQLRNPLQDGKVWRARGSHRSESSWKTKHGCRTSLGALEQKLSVAFLVPVCLKRFCHHCSVLHFAMQTRCVWGRWIWITVVLLGKRSNKVKEGPFLFLCTFASVHEGLEAWSHFELGLNCPLLIVWSYWYAWSTLEAIAAANLIYLGPHWLDFSCSFFSHVFSSCIEPWQWQISLAESLSVPLSLPLASFFDLVLPCIPPFSSG